MASRALDLNDASLRNDAFRNSPSCGRVESMVLKPPPRSEPLPAPRPVPVTPSEERWQKMTRAERDQFMIDVNEALSDPVITMSEGRPHKKAKTRAIDMLGLHFRAMGRHIYLAEEMSVLYPGEPGFSPDVLAVLDVEEPEDDKRMSWCVMDEGKGLDWVLEVLWAGDRDKDLVNNVERYARLGIPEYFVYDKATERLLGYRLPPESKKYQPIVPQAGLYRSNVLGLDLAIVGGNLRFYHGAAELYNTTHLIRRLETMIENLEARADEAARAAEAANRNAEAARIGLRITATLASRGIALSETGITRIETCTDPEVLGLWLRRATTATTENEVFGG
ncbi:MAG: Uma2 family endonuclease [Polyangiaceae bacterium]|nr:Uma2 family endonuclease [Polyangiaceae bacterium]